MKKDTDLESLRQHPGYAALLRKIEATSTAVPPAR
jgi:hypothetical protein